MAERQFLIDDRAVERPVLADDDGFSVVGRCSGLIALPDDAQSFEREEFVDLLDMPRSARDQRRLPAGGDHARLCAQHRFHALENAVHQIGEAVEQPGLHRMRRVRADDFSGIANLHAPQPRRAREKRIGGNADARHQRAAQIFAALGDAVEIDGRAEIHHDARPAVFGERRHAVDDAVRAHFLRIVVVHGHARLDARLDEERLGVKIALGHFLRASR